MKKIMSAWDGSETAAMTVSPIGDIPNSRGMLPAWTKNSTPSRRPPASSGLPSGPSAGAWSGATSRAHATLRRGVGGRRRIL